MKKINVLYLSYTGLLEPLGRSQVLAYMSRLSRDYDIRLVTFEKHADLLSNSEMVQMREECQKYGIEWRPLRYHHRPRLLATAWDLFLLLVQIVAFALKPGKNKIIHCRGYVTSVSAWLVSRVIPVKFIFDMRALWPEEMIEAKSLVRDSRLHKILMWLERRMVLDAPAVVSLTHAAVGYLKSVYPKSSDQLFAVIPTCVDLERFSDVRTAPSTRMTVGVMGTILSGWYHADWLFRLFGMVRESHSQALLKIVSRDSHEKLMGLAHAAGVDPSALVMDRGSPAEVPGKIADISFAVLFFTSGLSKLGSSPTRMAEFFALGIPVFANSGVGDMAEIIQRYRVGVVVDDGSDDALRKGLAVMMDLLSDPDLSARCRHAANDYFSVESGSENYRKIYQALSNG